MKKKSLALLIFVFCLCARIEAQESDITIYSARAAAMGNSILSIYQMDESFYYNPAVLSFRNNKKLSFLLNGIGYMSKNAPGFFNFMNSNHYYLLRNFAGRPVDDMNYLDDRNACQNVWHYRGLSNFSLEYMNKGFALTFLTYYRQGYQLTNYRDYSRLMYQDDMSFVTTIGYSKKIPYHDQTSPLSVGFSLQWQLAKRNPIKSIQDEELLDLYYSTFSLDKIFTQYPDVFNNGVWQNRYYLHFGMLYEFSKYHLNIATVLNNLIGKNETSQPKMCGNLGISYFYPALQNRKFIKNSVISWNVIHIGMGDEKLLENNILGMELQFPVVSIRSGLFKGRLTYGVGLNIASAHVDFASSYQEICQNHYDQLYVVQFRFGSK